MRAVDCQGFAGGFALGVVQAGFELVGKRENVGGFGVPAMEGNRRLLGNNWEAQACLPEDWEPVDADLVFGNPPCSGFSGLSVAVQTGENYSGPGKMLGKHGTGKATVNWRGVDNPINNCMRDLINFGARCRGAEMLILESVQSAGKTGRVLMQELRATMEATTGARWGLWHVFHNNLSHGGYSMRKRYFLVLSKVPFGVEHGEVNLATLRDAIGDLEDKPLGSINGHVTLDNRATERSAFLASKVEWLPGETSGEAFDRWLALGEEMPAGLLTKGTAQLSNHMRAKHLYAPRRWDYDKPARVVDGATIEDGVHPSAARCFTHRELARMLGYPDNWSADPHMTTTMGAKWWGKGIPVGSGKWVADFAKASLEGQPGSYDGELIGEREYLIDTTNDWKPAKPATKLDEPVVLTGTPRGKHGRNIAAYYSLYPLAPVADVATAVGCSVGRVGEALAGRG